MRLNARSVEIEAFRTAFGKRVTKELREEIMPAIDKQPKVDGNSPSITASSVLVVTEEDIAVGRAPAGSEGKFWFVVGYSVPGEGDIVRP